MSTSVQQLSALPRPNNRRGLSGQDLPLLACGLLYAGFLLFEYAAVKDQENFNKVGVTLFGELLVLAAVLGLFLLAVAWRRTRLYEAELTRRLAAEQRAHDSARHDSLTGLPNRQMFTENAGEALGRAWKRGSHCAVLFIDLDGFKPVNDTYGHGTGDALLVEIAGRLRRCAPDPALVARLGGDEFAVLVEYSRGEDVLALTVRRVLEEIQRPITANGNTVKVSASVGAAIGPESGRRAADLINAADLAMYEVKRAGQSVAATESA
jgi:diguanylate cyclase (GGDEF)-like protein